MAVLLAGLLLLVTSLTSGQMMAGRGIADMTGLAAEGVLYGYANPNMDARGLHLRQFSRAFIFQSQGERVAVVVCDVALISQDLTRAVMERLDEMYGGMYTYKNVMLLPQHSHSTPGGMNTYWMYVVPQGGKVQETVDAYVNGIVESISRAHTDLQSADLFLTVGDLMDANINRSPYGYDNNPQEEKDRYEYDVEKRMWVLKITDNQGDDMGMLNFFPVHTTSMKNYNHMLSTDNKGYAAVKTEETMNPPGTLPGQGDFVAGFAQAAEADATPNINGSYCESGELCWYNTSTCPEAPQNPTLCMAYGPAREMYEDTRIIGERQFLRALDLYAEEGQEISGPVDVRHQWLNMSAGIYLGDEDDGRPKLTCAPAMGYSMAAGATDGPGIPPFYQGDTEGSADLDDLIDFVWNYTEEFGECHAPKPVLLPGGEVRNPWLWQPDVVPLQLVRIGQLFLIGIPGEVTTMAGRRLEETVKQVLEDAGEDDITAVVVSMANCFTSYITTIEEYAMQRYEGASVTYGPYTLETYQIKMSEFAQAMIDEEEVEEGPLPPDMRDYPDNALGPLLNDLAPEGMAIGDVLHDVDMQYGWGDTASVVFAAGNPRHDVMTGRTFLEVQHLDDDEWNVVFTDAHWETKFWWDSSCHDVIAVNRTNCHIQQYANATIDWEIPVDTPAGQYRIRHYGYYKDENEGIIEYEAESSVFTVVGELRGDKQSARLQREDQRYADMVDAGFVFLQDEHWWMAWM